MTAGEMERAKNREHFVSGFVSILGRPNAGKSTLLNQLLGTKVAIVSDKPQTTRTGIQGVLNLPGAQVVFMDTPGIHRPDTLINKKMAQDVAAAQAVALVGRARTPTLLLLNKVDLLKDKARLLPLIEQYRELGDFEEFIPISALTGDGVDRVREAIVRRLPEGPRYFCYGSWLPSASRNPARRRSSSALGARCSSGLERRHGRSWNPSSDNAFTWSCSSRSVSDGGKSRPTWARLTGRSSCCGHALEPESRDVLC